jgi:N-acetylneuraminic acid mutarotase
MAISNKGYVGTGFDGNNLKDMWEYNPATDTWIQKTSIGGSKRRNATTFVIGTKGYLLTGEDNSEYMSDLWEYDPGTDTWTKKRSIADVTTETFDDKYTTIAGVGKVGFTINGKGYLATGGKTAGTEVWEYNPSTDLWQEKTAFEASTPRQDAVGFAIANRGYVTTGKSQSAYFDDIWAFDPDAALNEND